eukprot:9069006-Heterocapsa_arctica.AAC.1
MFAGRVRPQRVDPKRAYPFIASASSSLQRLQRLGRKHVPTQGAPRQTKLKGDEAQRRICQAW